MKLLHFFIWSALFLAVTGNAIIDSELKLAYDNGGYGSLQNLMVTFDPSPHQVIQQINQMTFSNIHERRSALTKAQQELANQAQEPLQKFLQSINVHHQTFWINNKMYIPSVSSDLMQVIANFPGVARIEKELVIQLDPIISVGEPQDFGNETIRPEATTVEWGIKKIRADKVWSKGVKGKGVVVAGIDTGVRFTHEALKGRWREKHGWFDPYKKTPKPNDENGHGTHTIATIAGTHGVGVAPEATWIACGGCPKDGDCKESALVACGQWIQCPTDHLGINADCSLAPDVVSNSWSFDRGEKFFDGVVASWAAADIIPVFSIGNTGPHCGTTRYPGDRQKVIGVGSIDNNTQVSDFSSIGPTADKKMKPDIAAPGGEVRSAWFTSDTAYNTISGTSMACPHVSGVIALMRQKSRHLAYEKIYHAITTTAIHDGLGHHHVPDNCGGTNSSKFPNNVYGHGLICAEKSVGAV